MSSKQIMAAITEASELGIFAISFTGGEPTLRPDWLKIVTHARQSNIHVSIATNGYAFDERTIGELVGLGVLDIALSLDHYQESYNDKLRGSGAWARFVSRARTLLSNNVRLSCSITVARETFSDIRQTLSFVRDLGIKTMRIQCEVRDFGKGELALSRNELRQLGTLVKNWRDENPEIEIHFACVIGFLNYLYLPDMPLITDSGLCTVGTNILTITPEGDVTTCVLGLTPEDKLGNLKTKSLTEVLTTPQVDVSRWRKKGLLEVLEPNTKCSPCNSLQACRGGCRGMSQLQGGFFGSDTNCPAPL